MTHRASARLAAVWLPALIGFLERETSALLAAAAKARAAAPRPVADVSPPGAGRSGVLLDDGPEQEDPERDALTAEQVHELRIMTLDTLATIGPAAAAAIPAVETIARGSDPELRLIANDVLPALRD